MARAARSARCAAAPDPETRPRPPSTAREPPKITISIARPTPAQLEAFARLVARALIDGELGDREKRLTSVQDRETVGLK
jgi:hypothetical protein